MAYVPTYSSDSMGNLRERELRKVPGEGKCMDTLGSHGRSWTDRNKALNLCLSSRIPETNEVAMYYVTATGDLGQLL